MDEFNQDSTSSDSTQMFPSMSDSVLDELFPTLGDNVPTSNPLAMLLNSLGSSEERGSQTTSLYNPFNLSPPKLHEIHAIAAANLISQTQEAIMQEYNITELDFEKPAPCEDNLVTPDQAQSVNTNLPISKKDLSLKCEKKYLDQNVIVPNIRNCAETREMFEMKHRITQEPVVVSDLGPENEDTELKSAVKNILSSPEKDNFSTVKADHSDVDFKVSKVCPNLSGIPANKPILNIPRATTVEKRKWNEIATVETDMSSVSSSAKESPISFIVKESSKLVASKHTVNEPAETSEKEDMMVGPFPVLTDEKNNKNEKMIMNSHVNGSSKESSHAKRNLLLRPVPTTQSEIQSLSLASINQSNPVDKVVPSKIIYVCYLCYKQFTNRENLDVHCEDHQKYVCPETDCVRTFVSRGHLHYHIQSHEGRRPFQCNICCKTFLKAQHLEAHARTHTQEKPFQCLQCDKSFTTEGNLKNHQRLHSGERPYICDVENCGKAFAELSSLKKHKVTHSGEKPYKCPVCDKGFTQASSRSFHMKKHKEKPS